MSNLIFFGSVIVSRIWCPSFGAIFLCGLIKRNRNLAITTDEREKRQNRNETCSTQVKVALFQKLDRLNESFSSSN